MIAIGAVRFGGLVFSKASGAPERLAAKDGRRISFYMVIPACREEIEYKPEKDWTP